jgi:hypothetical protein
MSPNTVRADLSLYEYFIRSIRAPPHEVYISKIT